MNRDNDTALKQEASVVIPVKNGEEFLDELLTSVKQQGPGEILVIDSGSSDRSLQIATNHGVRVLQIAPEEFGHGRTRNLGAENTKGRYICFLTQDATPTGRWLDALLEGFSYGDRVGVSYGPHLPRPTTSPMIARELTEFFMSFTEDGQPVIQGKDDPVFLSNVNACYLRECWEQIRFRDLPYSEDQAFAADMLAAGWLKLYHPAATVLHAHDYGPIQFVKRYFDEYRGLKMTVGHIESTDLHQFVGTVLKQTQADRQWLHKQNLTSKKRAYWTVRSAIHHTGRKVGSIFGSRSEQLPEWLQQRFSLEGTVTEKTSSTSQKTDLNAPPQGRLIPAQNIKHRWEKIAAWERNSTTPLAKQPPLLAEQESLHLAFFVSCNRATNIDTLIDDALAEIIKSLSKIGHRCSIWFDTEERDRHKTPLSQLPDEIDKHYGLDDWSGADTVVATDWPSIYSILLLDKTYARIHLVTNYEPSLYATSVQQLWSDRGYSLEIPRIYTNHKAAQLNSDEDGNVIPLGIDQKTFHPRHGQDRSANSVVLFASSHAKNQAVNLGISALEDLKQQTPDLNVVAFGEDMNFHLSFPHIRLINPDKNDLAEEFSKAKVGLCLSLSDPPPLLQAMLACGLPCVTFKENQHQPEGTLGAPSLTPNSVADTLQQLLLNDSLWETLSLAAQRSTTSTGYEKTATALDFEIRKAIRSAGESN